MSTSARAGEPVLSVEHLCKSFVRAGERIDAVTDVSFTIGQGETVALIGESGSGKSTIGRLILGLHDPDSGSVTFEGRSLTDHKGSELRRLRARLQVVFQEPYQSLNPKRTVFQTLEEPLLIQGDRDGGRRRNRVGEILELVGLAQHLAARYPGELSGGQQQRVGIARAIIGNPRLVVLDEPTASLDRTIRRQIADLLQRLQRELDLSYLLITHDIGSIRRMAARTQVLFRGRLVESGRTDEILGSPAHPYTRALISAELPAGFGVRHQPYRLKAPASRGVVTPQGGCPLVPSCPLAIPQCSEAMPPQFTVSPTHRAACLRHDEVSADAASAPETAPSFHGAARGIHPHDEPLRPAAHGPAGGAE